jgi:tetratricopeptide (TPR) repeat protein
MGKCYLKLKEEERAIEAYKRCIDLDPGDLEKDYRGKLGSLYEEWGNIDMAI